MRRFLLAGLFTFLGCHRLVPTRSVDGHVVPRVLVTQYPQAEFRTFRVFTVPNLQLWTVSQSVPDHSSSQVVGVDSQEHLYSGWELAQRARIPDANAMAVRVLGILLETAGGEPMQPGSTEGGSFVDAEQRAAITAPQWNGEQLVFWSMRGEMSPTLTRITADFGSRRLRFVSARQFLHPPPDPLIAVRTAITNEPNEGAAGVARAVTALVGPAQSDEDFRAREDVLDVLLPLLQHRDQAVRQNTRELVGYLRNPRGVAPLVQTMQQAPTELERIQAAMALLQIRTPDAINAVRARRAVAGTNERMSLDSHLSNLDRR